MIIETQLEIHAGEDSVFGDDVAASLIGELPDGTLVTFAERTAPDTILLTITKEIPDELITSTSDG